MTTTFIKATSSLRDTLSLSPFLLFLILFLTIEISTAQHPFQNSNLSSEERAKDLVSRLTIAEKASLMYDQSPAIPRLGIKKFNWWSEALHGYANNDSVTVFPEPIGMAASFDDTLLYKIFDAASDEARVKYHRHINRGGENKRFLSLSVWTPNVNIFRDPRWGRGQETYGEDPYLTSRMGVAVVRGLQGSEDSKYRKLLACAKHFAVHSGPEWSRHTLNLNMVSNRDLMETYLPAFKSLVVDADVRQVMCAYQRLDDEPCCSNVRLLDDILRKDWGFKHVVVSDCGAITDFYTSHKVSSDPVHAAARGVNGGTDLECVWEGYAYGKIPEAVSRGLLNESLVDAKVTQLLKQRFELGEFDDDAMVPWANIPEEVLNSKKHKDLALEMARKSLTLLQNKGAVLPIQKNIKKLAVIGPNADNETMLWGNYNGTPIATTSILEGIKAKLPKANLVYDKACDHVEDKVTLSYFNALKNGGNQGFTATYWNNPNREGTPVMTDQIRNPMKLTTAGQHEFASGVKLEGFSAKYEGDYTATETEEIVFKCGATGYFELKVDGKTKARYSNWRTLPSRIPLSVEKGKTYHIEILFAQLNNWQANIEFDFGKEVDVNFDALIKKLEGIDIVIFAGGLSPMLEGEEMPVSYPGFKGGDRTDIQLPKVQRQCLQALKNAGKKVIYINNSGSAVGLVPETDSCAAILQAWYAGELGGQAIADVLFGDYNPAGKLPVTFYKDTTQLKDIEDYDMAGRTYRYMESEPLFRFGYGLSYTNFTIGTAEFGAASIKAGDDLMVRIPITNVGKLKGTEIIQVYVRKLGDSEGPILSLKGFQRVELMPGESRTANIKLTENAFAFYNDKSLQLEAMPGQYEVFYGNSSAKNDLKSFKVELKP